MHVPFQNFALIAPGFSVAALAGFAYLVLKYPQALAEVQRPPLPPTSKPTHLAREVDRGAGEADAGVAAQAARGEGPPVAARAVFGGGREGARLE